jgi:hypothetical protein
MWTFLNVALLTALCGLGDALGFIHAGRIWQDGRFVWAEALKSALGFQFGVAMYWLALRELTARGVMAPETQTLFWFGATIIAVALISGQFLRWHAADQFVGAAVLAGIGWLLSRGAA